MKALKIVADENIPGLNHYFDQGLQSLLARGDCDKITIEAYPGRDISAEHLINADMLLVRSVTTVNAALISQCDLKFVGSCTIGTDHLDLQYLDQMRIHWANAPGCNANAVAEYVLQQVVQFAADTEQSLSALRVGIVGFGNVGRRVAEKMDLVGVHQLLVSDPPLVDQGISPDRIGGAVPLAFASLAEVFSCDVVTLHTPLTRTGQHATYHLVHPDLLRNMPSRSLLLNTGRGPVMDLAACVAWRESLQESARQQQRWVFDVFEDEPAVNPARFEHLQCATPHIAGHSQIGKEQGTRQVWQQALTYFGLPIDLEYPMSRPLPHLDILLRNAQLTPADWAALFEQVSGLMATDVQLRAVLKSVPPVDWGSTFEAARRAYQPRMELSQVNVVAPTLVAQDVALLRHLGVTVEQ